MAELGVVMFLFLIGLEMRPSHLWSMRHDIFGLGAVQVLVCGAFLTVVGLAYGFPLTSRSSVRWASCSPRRRW